MATLSLAALHPSAHSFQHRPKNSNPSPVSTLYTSTDDELHSDYKQQGLAPTSTRKIRFAPLPDPRRAVLVTDDGQELPLPNVDDDDDCTPPASILSRAQSTPTINVLPSSPLTPCDSNVAPNSPIHRRGTSLPNASPQCLNQDSPKSPKSGKRNFLLRPFGRRRSSVDQSSITPEEILTLGTINLFRTSSRESRRSTTSTDSAASAGSNTLARWASNNSFSKRTNRKSDMSNLYRTQSAGALADRSAARHAPKRMLNGRVYGSKHRKHDNNQNYFANIKDEEPEFVEWGYGGMGSVKNAASHGSGVNWSKVQGSGTGLGENDDDDQSGLAWVRKRKEERERKAREEKERAEAAAAATTTTTTDSTPVEPATAHSPTSVATPSAATPSAPSPPNSPPLPSTPAIGTPSGEAVSTPREEHHHVLTTKVSAPPRHHHHRTHSAPSSNAQLPNSGSISSASGQNPAEGASAPGVPLVQQKDEDEEIVSPSGSASSEDADSDSETDSDDDDDDDLDEVQVTNSRLTSVGAGVEKISRHK